MLCLNRKIGQAIQINDDITITILEIKKNNVRIGVLYGQNSRVLRHEVYINVKAENIEAQFDGKGFSVAIEKMKKQSKAHKEKNKPLDKNSLQSSKTHK